VREHDDEHQKEKLPTHEVGSGNIFADLGLPNAEELQLKAALIVQKRVGWAKPRKRRAHVADPNKKAWARR
jgi:hypothetical protein